MPRKMLRGWHVPAGEETAHWFRRSPAVGYRSACRGVILLELWEQDKLHERVRKCRVCDEEVKDRVARGLPVEG